MGDTLKSLIKDALEFFLQKIKNTKVVVETELFFPFYENQTYNAVFRV